MCLNTQVPVAAACHARKLNPMGSSHSCVTDPNAFATEVKESDDRSQWKTYDYVIVGGGTLRHESRLTWLWSADIKPRQGTAGSVLASRLSEDPNVAVLLVEAGNRCATLTLICCKNH